MKIQIYDHLKHAEYASVLLESRHLKPVLRYDLPEWGYIAVTDEKPEVIAMGFIRLMEGDYAIMDSFITNPYQSSQIRFEALEAITLKLIILSKKLKLSKILGFSEDENMMKRFYRHGFNHLPWNMSALHLSKDDELCPS